MSLKQMRKLSGLKQYRIAEMLSITRQQYRNIENGESTISSDKLEILSQIFKKDTLEIYKAWENSKWERLKGGKQID